MDNRRGCPHIKGIEIMESIFNSAEEARACKDGLISAKHQLNDYEKELHDKEEEIETLKSLVASESMQRVTAKDQLTMEVNKVEHLIKTGNILDKEIKFLKGLIETLQDCIERIREY